MPLDVAVQMDHIAGIRIRGDSTFALMLEAQARGHRLWHYTADRLAMRDGKVFAVVEPVAVRDQEGDHFTLGDKERVDLSKFDVVHMRQDPPFDMHYVTATHLLERIHPKTLVVNDPAHVRNAPEKVFVLDFPDLMPPTLVTRDLAEIRVFHRNRFLCRAISLEHAGQAITFKDIQAARAAHRRALRGQINERIARVADFLPDPPETRRHPQRHRNNNADRLRSCVPTSKTCDDRQTDGPSLWNVHRHQGASTLHRVCRHRAQTPLHRPVLWSGRRR